MAEAPESALARHVAGLAFEAIPDETQDAVLTLLADTAACMIAGLRSARCARLRDTIVTNAGAEESSLVGAARLVPAAAAARHNGMLAHWYEWDDVYDPGAVHGSAVIFPALIGAAESQGVAGDGGLFLAAATVAFDVSCRIGRLIAGGPHGWMPTGIAGTIGAAAGAARIAGMDAEACRSAMGLAAAVCGVSRQPILDRASAKNAMAGISAAAALDAVALSRLGICGPPNFLFGDYGVAALFGTGSGDPAIIGDELGVRFDAADISLKPWPSCRSTHGGIEMALGLAARESDLANGANSVSIGVSPILHDLVGAPFAPGDDPRVAAQFSLPYTVALALQRGHVGIDDFDSERIIGDRAVRDLAARVTIRPEPPAWSIPGDIFAQEMTVAMQDGATRTARLSVLKGMPERPLGHADHRAKIADAVGRFLPGDGADDLLKAVGRTPADGIAPLMALLRNAG